MAAAQELPGAALEPPPPWASGAVNGEGAVCTPEAEGRGPAWSPGDPGEVEPGAGARAAAPGGAQTGAGGSDLSARSRSSTGALASEEGPAMAEALAARTGMQVLQPRKER